MSPHPPLISSKALPAPPRRTSTGISYIFPSRLENTNNPPLSQQQQQLKFHTHSQITLLLTFQKRRLSWTGTDSPAPSPVLLKCPRISAEEKAVKQDGDERDRASLPPTLATDANQNSPDVAGNSLLNVDTKGKDSDSEEQGKLSQYSAGQSSEPSLTWVHVAPILSPRKACPSHEGNSENQQVTAVLPPVRQGSPATQDSSISSTTPYKHPKNLKKPSRCQSQPLAGQQSESESETIETCQGQNQPPHVTLKPLSRVCPTPLETWCTEQAESRQPGFCYTAELRAAVRRRGEEADGLWS